MKLTRETKAPAADALPETSADGVWVLIVLQKKAILLTVDI
jgi:hypothetical protein